MPIKNELAKFSSQKESLISIGVFDGVHLGHQHLLNHLIKEANKRDCLSGVITFKSHPRWVLDSGIKVAWLNDLDMRISLLRNLGIDIVIPLEFTHEISQLTARQFTKYLKEYLKLSGLVVGPNFALGKGREGTIENLRSLGREMDFSVEVVPPLILDGEVVSSSLIRQTLAQGDMKKVTKLLGRAYSFGSRVVPGNRRGQSLGFPTANFEIKPEQAAPPNGIYATVAFVGQKILPAATNIGVSPTFGGSERLMETYIIGFEGELYGQNLRIEFIDRIRDEKRFENVEALKSQIMKDVEQAKTALEDVINIKGVSR
jgi:riboflavin kinase/FMN adenylyltransferase